MLRAALVAVLAAAAVGCSTPAPVWQPLPTGDPRPRELLDAWERSAAERRGLRGRAKLSVDAADGDVKLRGKQIVALERPARLRVEVQGLLGQTLAVLVTDGERYEFFRAGDRSYREGPVHRDLLWEHAWIALAPEEATLLLLGDAPPAADLEPLAARADAEGGVELELADGSGRLRRRLRFSPDGTLGRVDEYDAEGRELWVARFADYSPLDGRPFAHRIRLDVGAAGSSPSRAEIVLSDVELNPELSPDIFRLR